MFRSPMISFLSIPAPLRTLLLQDVSCRTRRLVTTTSVATGRPLVSHHGSGIPSSSSVSKAPPTLSFIPTPSNDPEQRALPSPRPLAAALDASTRLMTSPRPRFLYSAARFLNLPLNTLVPEVAVLGRSNVGKSTLINALAGRPGAEAGSVHGVQATRAGLAVTSSKAGCTKTMNGYGFGPAMSVPPEVLERNALDRRKGAPAAGGASRSVKRAERKKCGEPPPRHSLVLMDMPGYGLNSKDEWGVEIAKYLERRTMLKGAVVLLDAVAGVKDVDRMVLAMLRSANVRTTIVLTKADKLRHEVTGIQPLEKMCLSVWQTLRQIEKANLSWTEGKGWEKEIWITGAGDPKNGGLGLVGARMAICKMAGIVKDARSLGTTPAVTKPEIVPFDQILWATAPTPSESVL